MSEGLSKKKRSQRTDLRSSHTVSGPDLNVTQGTVLTITAFPNLPPGVTFVSASTNRFHAGSKTLRLAVIFKDTSRPALTALLRGTTPIVDEIFT